MRAEATRTRLSPLRHSLRSRLRNDSRVSECLTVLLNYTLLRRLVEPKQYTSHDYTQVLDDARVLASVGSVGDAYDNALLRALSTRSRPS